MVPPAIAKALERVREGADVMPKKQLLETIESHLGKNWRAPRGLIKDGGDVEVIDFNHEPMAAASIGQVHRATVNRRVTKGNSVGTTRGGASDEEHEFETLDVCMKIQYPGVARSIHSDIDNLVRMISYTDLIPAGLFVEHAVRNVLYFPNPGRLCAHTRLKLFLYNPGGDCEGGVDVGVRLRVRA